MEALAKAGPDKILEVLKGEGVEASRAEAADWVATAATLIEVT